MKTAHRYILEPYKGMNTRYRCPAPNCGNGRTFSLYIDTETSEHIHPTVGRCNRESNCGYHYTPKQYFQDNNISINVSQSKAYKPQLNKPSQRFVSYIPVEIFKSSLNLKAYETNNLVKFLIERFGFENTSNLVSRYFIATSKHWDGATVFWQIDTQGKVRTGKIMLYNPATSKRIKEPFNHITWVHSTLRQPEFELGQCLFGEHLLKDKTKPVAIVESEKTAIIASLYFPKYIWIATGGKENLNERMCRILKGRHIVLYPDINGYEHWSKKAIELSHLGHFTVSDILELKANKTEREQGWDIADYLLQYDLTEFLSSEPQVKEKEQVHISPNISIEEKNLTKILITTEISNTEKKISSDWKRTISELTDYFEKKEFPKGNIILKQGETIIKVTDFVKSHLSTIKTNEGKAAYLPFINRLVELKCYLEMKGNYDNISEN